MTRRLGGVGMRPALALTAAFVAPPAYATSAWLGARIDGHPSVLVALLIVAAALSAVLLVGFTPSPGVTQLVGRGTVLALVAIGVRLLVPSAGEALPAVAAREAGILALPFWPVFLLLVIAQTIGHAVGARVALFAEGPRNRISDRAGEQGLVTMWLIAAGVSLVTLGATRPAAGLVGGLLAGAGVMAGAGVIVHLRASTPHPGGRRPLIELGSPALRRRSATVGLAATGLIAVALAFALPPAVTEASPRFIAWLGQLEFSPDDPFPRFQPRDPEVPPDLVGAEPWRREEPPVEGDRIELEAAPVWPVAVVGTAVLVVLLAWFLRRADRWRRMVAAIWRWLRRPADRASPDDAEVTPATPGRAEVSRPTAWQSTVARFRPRPRDPRGAILHDYLRLDRTLGRHELGREGAETPLEHAERLALGEQLRELATLASGARFGRADPPPAAAERSRTLQRELARRVRHR